MGQRGPDRNSHLGYREYFGALDSDVSVPFTLQTSSFSVTACCFKWSHKLAQTLFRSSGDAQSRPAVHLSSRSRKSRKMTEKFRSITSPHPGPQLSLCPMDQPDKSIGGKSSLAKASQSHTVGPPANVLILAARSLPAKTPSSCSNIWCLKRLTLIIHLYLTQPRFLDKRSYKGIRKGRERIGMHTCFSKQSVKTTRLGGGRAGQAADPTEVHLAQPQADSGPMGRESC